MDGLLGGILGALKPIMEKIATDNARKYIDRNDELSREILAERQKGVDRDDAKLETLLKEKGINAQSMINEINLYITSK